MSSNVSGYLHSSQDSDRADINKILTALAQISPTVDQAAHKEFIAFSPETRIRTTSVIVGSPNITDTDDEQRQTTYMIRKIPTTVTSYPLTHTTTGSFTFQYVYNASPSSHMFGGAGKFSGSSYVIITDHSWLKPTDKITISGFFLLPASSGNKSLVRKENSYDLGLTTGNVLNFRIKTGGVWHTALTFTYTPNTWYQIVAVYDSAVGTSLYINGALQTSDVLTGAIDSNTNNVGIGNLGDGTNIVDSGTIFSWLSILHGAVNSTWVTNHNVGLIDLVTYTEITTMPFLGSELPEPNATSGICKSHA
jgi:hypothetical protein